MQFKQDTYNNRRSIRLKNYNYAQNGSYFITLCTKDRQLLFGDILNGEMILNKAGNIVEKEWLQSAKIRKEIIIDQFCIMPNHFHAIVFIDGDVGANGVRPDDVCTNKEGECHSPLHRMKPKSLSSLISGFKSSVTRKINQMRNIEGTPVWQRNYFEHVIRNENDLAKIRKYVAENPAKWDTDKNNPINRRGERRSPR